jgi:hypothetical protein
MRGKGNYGSPPPAATFGINAKDFELNGYSFSEPIAAAFAEEPELSLEELVRGPHQTGPPGAPKRDALREPLLAALGRRPQGVRTLAELVGGKRQTTTAALEELERDGLAEKSSKGWLAGRSYRGDRPATHEGTVVQLPLDRDEDGDDPEETEP